MDSRIKEIVKIGDGLFSARGSLMDYWQQLAEHFYPERADFTVTTTLGNDRSWLMTSEPVLMRRELGNTLQAMLRPEAQDWFGIHLSDEDVDEDNGNRRWLEWMSKVQRRAMYAAPAHFVQATEEADHDWVTFGQSVIEIDVRRDQPALIYRCGHLRDHAWSENAYGEIDTVYREWRPTAAQLVQLFPSTVDDKVRRAAEKTPNERVSCCRIVMPRDAYAGSDKTPAAQWMSVYIDKDNEKVLEEAPRLWNPFVIPRWQTVSGSQYGWSPCTGPGLADARLLQSVMRIILEAGEKAVDPPLVAVQDAVRSDMAVYAGGVTWVDREYDERLGEALRPLSQDRSGLPIGLEIVDRLNRVMTEGFFLNKIRLPADQGNMTAYEVRKRVEEHIRSAAPLLAPAEDNYSSPVCERTFEALRAMRAFGPAEDFPQGMRGKDIRYEFTSPLREMADELEAQKLVETVEIMSAVAPIDPTLPGIVEWEEATRGSLEARSIPAKWIKNAKKYAKEKAELERAKAMQAGMEGVAGASQAVGSAADAAMAARQAGII